MPSVRAFVSRRHTQGVARKLAVPWAEGRRAFSPKGRERTGFGVKPRRETPLTKAMEDRPPACRLA